MKFKRTGTTFTLAMLDLELTNNNKYILQNFVQSSKI